jgi:hypothetical protein
MVIKMTVAEIFRKARLSPCGPVRWMTQQVPESSAGVYVVARVPCLTVNCRGCTLPFIDPLPSELQLDLEFERQQWLRLQHEPAVYIGQTTRQTIRKRVEQFYQHKCGRKGPHAGGQIVKLLKCDMYVYWSPASNPKASEQMMICAFKEQVGQLPFANGGNRIRKRIRCLT